MENFSPNIETNDAVNIDVNKCGNLSSSDRGRARARIVWSIRLRAGTHAGSKNPEYSLRNVPMYFRAYFPANLPRRFRFPIGVLSDSSC